MLFQMVEPFLSPIKDLTGLKETSSDIPLLSRVFMDVTVSILIEDLDGNVLRINDEAVLANGKT